MKPIGILVAFAFLTLIVPGHPSRAQSVSKVEGVVSESGTNQPLKGVQVFLKTKSDSPYDFGILREGAATTITDAEGRFSIEATPGRYRVVPVLEGFVYAATARVKTAREQGLWVQLPEWQQIRNLRLGMTKEGVISGRVLDIHGQPPAVNTIPGINRQSSTATVTVMQYGYTEFGKRE